jgi:hypothetical protein
VRLISSAAVGLVAEYLTEFGQDLRYAVRRLLAAPGFTTIGILSLALGVTMSSIFLLRLANANTPAPGVRDPRTLVAPERLVAFPYCEEYRDQHELFSATSAFLGLTPFTVGFGDLTPNSERTLATLFLSITSTHSE